MTWDGIALPISFTTASTGIVTAANGGAIDTIAVAWVTASANLEYDLCV